MSESEDVFYVVSRVDGTWVVNDPRTRTVRYWTLRSVVESWKNEWAPGGMIHPTTRAGMDRINEELKRA
jgi:hypothetical protein